MKKLIFMFALLIAASFAVAPATYAGSHGHDSKSASDSKSKGDKTSKDDKSKDDKSKDDKSKDDKSKDDKSHDKGHSKH